MTIRFNGVRIKPCATGGGGGSSATYIQPVGDPQVSLLLHMDGANNSTTFVDESYTPKNITAHGSAKITTSTSKFGEAAMFDGNGDYLSWTKTSDLNFGSSSFTVEGWFYFNVNNIGYQPLISFVTSGDNQGPILATETNNALVFYGSNGSSWTHLVTSSTVPTTGEWHHIAAVGTTGQHIKLYLNGAQIASLNGSYDLFTGNTGYVGYYPFPGGIRTFNGYVDEVRITIGAARYTSNFTPSTSAFPNADGSVELPSSPAVGQTVYSDDRAYVCTNASPVVWKAFGGNNHNIQI